MLISRQIVAQEGYILAVRALDTKEVYNRLERADGTFTEYAAGHVIVGAIGERQALRGYSGIVPRAIKVGDTLNILNMGGILGVSQSEYPEFGPACRVEVLGAVMIPDEDHFKHASIQDFSIEWKYELNESAPLIAITGTCMNVGKTKAAAMIVQQLTSRGYRIAAAKLTGASLLRDTRSMKDNGAIACTHFSEAGLVSTTNKNILPMAKGLIAHLNRFKPDAIMLEFGDGIIGAYGVDSLLMDKELQRFIKAHVVAAQDLIGCWAADHFFRERYIRNINVITGPVTDNIVGTQFIQNTLGIYAANAVTESAKLATYVEDAVFKTPGVSV